jgi:hypothetical protein
MRSACVSSPQNNGFDWGEIVEAANSLSLFAEKRLIELRIREARFGDGKKILQAVPFPSIASRRSFSISWTAASRFPSTRSASSVTASGSAFSPARLQRWAIQPGSC